MVDVAVRDLSAAIPLSFFRVDGEETFLFLSNRRDRETNPELVKNNGVNHYPRAPALNVKQNENKCLAATGCINVRVEETF